ncbi:hypothetical protein [Streptomyces oceani]|uniref:DUF8175 domain-containing protein n=1 Tax=Streptomyces oceani TaxID=1075402 RepID=A0A1E7JY47_9ACTN|nr:hypothetical protein [Streptomyces oceani]OEU96572.1 hypothetical protein AN216_20095 [Streptomyces oceani]
MARRSKHDEGEWEQPFYQQRGWLLSAGFLLALVALAGMAALVDIGDSSSGTQATNDEDRPSPSSSERKPGGDRAEDGRPAGCRTDDSAQEEPTEPPKDLKWKNIGSNPVPTSPTAGPLQFDGPVWSCYAHTPMGAVMAAHSIIQHIPYSGWEELAEEQFVPNKGREVFLKKRAEEEDRPLSAPPNDIQYAGFQMLSYSKEQASVMMLLHFSADVYFSAPVDLQWHEGDWKLELSSDGSYSPDPTMVDGTNGFVTWGK